MNFAYSRVSTQNQDLTSQSEALKVGGYEIDEIFEEKISGKNKDRPKLQEMLSKLRKDDKVIVTKLDRLARSLKDLLDISDEIHDKKCDLVVLDQNIDTSQPTGRLVFSMLGALAEFERSLIIERTSIGRRIAKENGVKFGRKPKTTDRDLALIKVLHQEGKSYNEIANQLDLSRITVYRKLIKMRLIQKRMSVA
jgi:DNA invertase Pin-like site-specific DNA recombinase